MSNFIIRFLKTIRSKWHGDLYVRLDDMKNDFEREIDSMRQNLHSLAVGLRCDRIDDSHSGAERADSGVIASNVARDELLATIREWHMAMLYNQISLSNRGVDRHELYTPWSEAKHAVLYRDVNGRLCFSLIDGVVEERNPVSVFSIPKSGTHYVAKILQELGFHFHVDRPMYGGKGALLVDTVDGKEEIWDLPASLYHTLLLPGQGGSGHIWTGELLDDVIKTHGDNIIVAVRDLRYATVSWVRMEHKNASMGPPSSDDIIKYLNSPSPNLFDCALAVEHVWNRLTGRIVRFEELITLERQKMEASLNAIANASGYTCDEVFQALNRAFGTKTNTYTGKFTSIGNIWTKKVEEVFRAKGYDALNERLGYPRTYVG